MCLFKPTRFFRNDIVAMNKYYVRNQEGKMLPLSSVMTYKVTDNASMLPHYNLYRVAEFVGNAKARDIVGASAEGIAGNRR